MRTIRYLPLAAIAALLAAACSVPLQPLTWTDAQKATIATAVSGVTTADLNTILTDPAISIVRSVTATSQAQLDAAKAALIGYFPAGVTTQTVPVTVDRAWTWDGTANGWAAGPFTMDNIIGTRLGTDTSLAPVLVTAHWDSMPQTVGMDDNASGCAGVLEVAKVLQGLPLKRTVVFVLFSFEEGGLSGSTAYAAAMTSSPSVVIDLEMIGYTNAVQNPLPLTDVLLSFPSVGNFIGVVASDFSKNLGLSFCTTAAQFVPTLPTYYIGADANLQNNPLLTDFLRSDHTPFWARGVPAIMVTDTSFLRGGTAYHTAGDVLSTLDMPFLTSVVQATAALTILEAGLP